MLVLGLHFSPKSEQHFFLQSQFYRCTDFQFSRDLKLFPLTGTLRFSQSLLQLTIKYILFLTTFTHSGLSSHTCRVHFMEMTFLREKKCSIFMPNLATKNLRNICHAFWNEQVSMSHLAFVRFFFHTPIWRTSSCTANNGEKQLWLTLIAYFYIYRWNTRICRDGPLDLSTISSRITIIGLSKKI